MILFYDFETTGRLIDHVPLTDPKQPRVVSAAAIAFDDSGTREVAVHYAIVRPDDFVIPDDVVKVHGITQQYAMENGINGAQVLAQFLTLFQAAKLAVAFNNSFDNRMAQIEILRRLPDWSPMLDLKKSRCAMMAASGCMKKPNRYGYEGYAWPKLSEAFEWMYGRKMEEAHHSLHDTRNTAWLSLDMQRMNYWDIAGDRVLI